MNLLSSNRGRHERFTVPGVGWLAYVKDTEGNVFGLWEEMK